MEFNISANIPKGEPEPHRTVCLAGTEDTVYSGNIWYKTTTRGLAR